MYQKIIENESFFIRLKSNKNLLNDCIDINHMDSNKKFDKNNVLFSRADWFGRGEKELFTKRIVSMIQCLDFEDFEVQSSSFEHMAEKISETLRQRVSKLEGFLN